MARKAISVKELADMVDDEVSKAVSTTTSAIESGTKTINFGFSMMVDGIKDEVMKYIQEEYGPIERKITTTVNGKKYATRGFLHDKFDTVLKFVANDEPVFLTGPAGSGKNFLCKQVAESLGLNFYFSNAITQEYKLTGFTDANGNYQPTQF